MTAEVLRRHERKRLLGLDFSAIGMDALLDAAMAHVRDKEPASVVFLNTDVVLRSEKDDVLRKMIGCAEYVLADGMPLIWISKLFRRPLPEKVSGSDFVPLLCRRAAEEGVSVFFVGGSETALEKACARLREQCPGLRVDGCSPPWGFEQDPGQVETVCQAVRRAAPDILIVCLGCPKQERFVYECRERCGATVSVCAGATVNFLAGTVKRCPAWMSQVGLEWFYRFTQEPKRLFRRYFIDDMQIVRLILKYRRETP